MLLLSSLLFQFVSRERLLSAMNFAVNLVLVCEVLSEGGGTLEVVCRCGASFVTADEGLLSTGDSDVEPSHCRRSILPRALCTVTHDDVRLLMKWSDACVDNGVMALMLSLNDC